jgi:hypothetical protein
MKRPAGETLRAFLVETNKTATCTKNAGRQLFRGEKRGIALGRKAMPHR